MKESSLILRREFLSFMGKSAATASILGLTPFLNSCASTNYERDSKNISKSSRVANSLPFEPLEPSTADELSLAAGFSYQIIAKWGDPINSRGDLFGTNNDYLAFFPLTPTGDDGILWVNHEYLKPLFVSGATSARTKTKEQVLKEQLSVGGSLIRVRKNRSSQKWELVQNDPLNRRLTAQTEIPLISERPILGSKTAIGTFANCAGGVTPWGTLLTCEENYSEYYGEAFYDKSGKRSVQTPSSYGWEAYFDRPPEHYGWVVEVNPLTGQARKLTSLGRFAHECATVRLAKDDRAVVYSGDDSPDRCLYKFVSNQRGSLDSGTLYVANLEKGQGKGEWISLDIKTQKVLRDHFKDQTEVLIRCREAAELVGGTPLARPEDIEIDPVSGATLVTLTNNVSRGNYYGSILRLDEENNDPLSLHFRHSTFVAGGPESGFACPDNLAFDRKGNLWMTSDISGKNIDKNQYVGLGNNGLFYLPLHGPDAGKVFRVANAPNDAEITGPYFSSDGKTLFVSIQHPGEESKSLEQLTSRWPDYGTALPKSSVVAISGPSLDKLTEGPGVQPVIEVPVLKG